MESKNKGFIPLEIKIFSCESNHGNKRFLTGFTLVELLTVLAIIALLVGVLIPTLTSVKNAAKETKQKAQFATIDLALTAFKNDYGDYPPSNWNVLPGPGDYCGAQKLAEALFGRDLLGFHPNSTFLNATDPTWYPPYPPGPNDYNLSQRKGRYLELSTANVFKLGVSVKGDGLFKDTRVGIGTYQLNPDTYVLCDVFSVRQIRFSTGKVAMAGAPILYYKANTSSKTMDELVLMPDRIYNAFDDYPIIRLGPLTSNGYRSSKPHPLGADIAYFYSREYKVIDPKVTIAWPHRPDSYILISAGVDGRYGTNDDITNF